MLDFSKLNSCVTCGGPKHGPEVGHVYQSHFDQQIEHGKIPVGVKCSMCGHGWELPKREAEAMGGTLGTCPACGAGRWEGEGSRMLDALLRLEEGLTEWEIGYLDSMNARRLRARADGYKPDDWPSQRQRETLQRIADRLL